MSLLLRSKTEKIQSSNSIISPKNMSQNLPSGSKLQECTVRRRVNSQRVKTPAVGADKLISCYGKIEYSTEFAPNQVTRFAAIN